MKRGGKFLAICGAIAICGYVAYALLFPTYYIRYRLSLDTDVDGTVQTSSGVLEISYQIMPDSWQGLSGSSIFGGRMHGYAVTIDLGPRGVLFIINSRPLLRKHAGSATELLLPSGVRLSQLPLAAYGLPINGSPSSMEPLIRKLQMEKGTVSLPLEKLPMLIHFKEINNPTSIEEVDPRALEVSFGPGVHLLKATLEITDDPITRVPREWPIWLIEAKGAIAMLYLDAASFPEQINSNEFKGDQN